MMAVRERATTAMAALDRRIPSLDDFVGQSWSSWIDRAGIFVSEGCEVEECSKNGKRKVETMTLRKEDMSTFGLCPAHDDFYLVVCSHCGQVVKPQAFQRHCEARHGPLGKLYGRLHPSPSAGGQRPRPGHAPSRPGHAPSRSARDGRPQGAGPPRVPPQPPLPLAQHRPSKPLKEGSGLSPAEEASQSPPPPDSPPYSLSPGSRDPPWPQRSGPSPSEKPLPRQGELVRPPDFTSTLRTTRTYSKTYKKVPAKECNLDKHCGVLDPERKKLCTRLLTCNIHSIHQRRKVAGRSRSFNQLVAELKMSSRVRERAGQAREGPEVGSPSPEPPGGQTGAPACRRRLVNCAAPRSRTPSGSGAEEGEHQEEEPPHASTHTLAHSRLSSEESEGEGQEEPPDFPSTPWHPKPLALCSFGSHALGRSVFTFDRRLHHLRSALNAMVEHHLSAHLWKKIPQATDLQSQRTSATPPTVTSPHFNSQHSTGGITRGAGLHGAASSLRTSASSSSSSSLGVGRGGRPSNSSPSPGSACRVSEGKGGGQPITSPLQTSTPSPSGETRPRNPVGRPSKHQARLKEAERPSPPTPPKRRKPPPEDHSPSPARERNCSAHERGRPPGSSRTTHSPHGPINGALSPGSKPPRPKPPSPEPRLPSPGLSKWPLPLGHAPPPSHAQPPPPDPSSRGRGGGPGPHRKAVSYDHKGLGKKRKSGCPPTLPPPRPSKLPRLSAASHSGCFSWKKDGRVGGAPAGLGKGLGKKDGRVGGAPAGLGKGLGKKDGRAGGAPAGLGKGLGAQKPKLHH
ncbi:ataxin-7-like protein 2 isoform X1 [Anguilla rostrata]|uniref:ataxin-7-like protein 2 isoform X1 n=1 Tax=Anguilla rostrata TaxID=7938 RepID=UPI0030CFB4AB